MKKLISLILSFLIVFAVVNVQFTTAFAEEKEYLLKDYAENIKINSRAVFTEKGLEADFAGGGFSVNVNCEGNVFLTVNWAGSAGRIGVVINDDFESCKFVKVTGKGEQTVEIANNLAKGNYTIEIIKQNPQAVNQIVFKSLKFNGEMLQKPEQKELKLQFIGDSISSGVGAVLNADGSYNGGDGDIYYYSYNYLCSRKLNAEIHTCAIPGYGYYLGAVEGLGQDLYTYFEKSTVLQDIPYDNTNYIADVVVIELGTNDYNYASNNKIIVEDKLAYQVVQRYIDRIREFNKDCYIILMGRFGYTEYNFNINNKNSGNYFKITNAVQRAAAINEKVYYYQQPATSLTGFGYHPNQSEAKKIGEALADYIVEDILSGKESPDAILKEHFYFNYDVTGDDVVSTTDVLYMRNFLVKKLKTANEEDYDVNLDERVDIKDLLDLRKKLINLI